MTPINKTLLNPNFTDTLFSLKDDIFRSLNCVRVGEIQSFDGVKKTAEVQILTKRVLPNGKVQSYPLLVDCPVFTLQGGGGAIEMPITKGDQCIILFSDRNLDAWYKNGSEAAPFDSRTHDLSDGIVLVGLTALTSTLADYTDEELKIIYGGAKIAINNLDQITIRNQTTSLLTLLDGLIDVIAGITDANNVPLSGTSIAALAAYKTVLATFLY
jgi:hypothetical protein